MSTSTALAHLLDPYSRVIPGYSTQDAVFEAARLDADVDTVCRAMRRHGDREVGLMAPDGIQMVPAYEAYIRLEQDPSLVLVTY